ncbi:MAG: alpha/beta hydrolase [Bacteroidales bacterium]|nr:alpha/beta hydrolase [Bacteroidales bacterium]
MKFSNVCISVILLALMSSTHLFAREKQMLDSLARARVSGSFVNVPEGKIHYELAGSDTSKTVLLLCGLSAGYYIWDSTFLYLKNAGYKVIRFDHFGRGYSDRICGNYNKEFFMNEINELLEALDVREQIQIIAASMGGALAVEYAIANPRKVKSLTLIGPMIYASNYEIMQRDKLGALMMNVVYGPLIKRSQMKAFYNKKLFVGWDEQFKTTYGITGTKYALLQTIRNYLPEHKFLIYNTLKEQGTPVFLIWGKEDKIIEYKYNVTLRNVLDCTFLGIDRVGHLPQIEKSFIVHPAIVDFLSQNNNK